MNIINRILGTAKEPDAPVVVKEEDTTAQVLAAWMRYDPKEFILTAEVESESNHILKDLLISFVGKKQSPHIEDGTIRQTLNRIIEEVQFQHFRSLEAARNVIIALVHERLGYFLLEDEWPNEPGPSIHCQEFRNREVGSLAYRPKCVATYRINIRKK